MVRIDSKYRPRYQNFAVGVTACGNFLFNPPIGAFSNIRYIPLNQYVILFQKYIYSQKQIFRDNLSISTKSHIDMLPPPPIILRQVFYYA